MALAFKAARQLRPDTPLWRDFPYEYEAGQAGHRRHQRQRTAAPMGRRPAGTPADLERLAGADEADWLGERQGTLLY